MKKWGSKCVLLGAADTNFPNAEEKMGSSVLRIQTTKKKGTDLQLKDKSRTIKQGSKGVPLLRCIQKLAKERKNINNGLRGIHIFFPCVLQITNSTSTMSWSVWKLHLRSSLLWRLALLFTLIGVMIWISQHRQTPKKLLLTHTRARRTHIYPFYDLHWDESEHLNFDLK